MVACWGREKNKMAASAFVRRECWWGALKFADHFDQYSNSDSFKVSFLKLAVVIYNKS